MDNTTLLSLPLLANKQALQTTFYDEAMKALDALVMLSVLDRDLSSPPGSPSEGDRYIVQAPGSGDDAWVGGNVVVFVDGGWRAHPPQPGWTCYVQDEGILLAWDGSAWLPALDVFSGGVANDLMLLGVGTAADETNPFSAKLNNSLWTAKTVAEGGDGNLRTKMSKESAAKTLSVLFQDNFSGRAEIGLTGDNDFHFKVSPDGATWHEGLVIDKDTGAAAFPNGVIAEVARRNNVLTPHENLVIKYVSASTVDVDADGVVLFDTGGVAKRFASLNETLDITASGANGLDTGSESASTWYHIWAIGKPDGTLDGLLSASATSPTLPSDYIYKGYLGAVYNRSASDFAAFLQRGNRVIFESTSVLTNGTQTNYTAVDLSTVMPPTATVFECTAPISSSSGIQDVLGFLAPAGSGTTAAYGAHTVRNPSQGTTASQLGPVSVVLETSQTVLYRASGTNAQMSVSARGYTF